MATPSEGGAIRVTATLLLALAKRKLTGRNLRVAMTVTGILCSGIIFLLLGGSFFTLVFRGLDGQAWVESLFTNIPGGQIGLPCSSMRRSSSSPSSWISSRSPSSSCR